jgi:hypothetical protein
MGEGGGEVMDRLIDVVGPMGTHQVRMDYREDGHHASREHLGAPVRLLVVTQVVAEQVNWV